MSSLSRPSVGVAAVVWESDAHERLLLGLGHSPENRETTYAVPGGHWESGESLVEAIHREVKEEADIEIRDVALTSVYDFFNPEKGKSYVTIGFGGVIASGTPRPVESDRKHSWEWLTPEHCLTLPLFAPDEVLIRRALSGVIFG